MLAWLAVSALPLVAICINGQISLPESSRPPEALHRPDRRDPSNRDQPDSPDLPHIPDLPHLPDLPDLPGPRYSSYREEQPEPPSIPLPQYTPDPAAPPCHPDRLCPSDRTDAPSPPDGNDGFDLSDGSRGERPGETALLDVGSMADYHVADDVIKWKHFPRYWPFVRGIHRSPVDSPHKGQWRGALMCALINGWTNCGFGDLRRQGVLVTSQ